VRRLTILLATVAAFLLVPVAQAMANGTLTVNVAGSGSGEVSSVGGLETMAPEVFAGSTAYEGSPPIECSYASPGPATGVCADTMSNEGEEFEGTALHAVPAPGSEFSGWTVEGAEFEEFCGTDPGCLPIAFSGEGEIEVTATFTATGSGPTNRRTLTLTKSPDPSLGAGQGTVSSKPKGIKCATGCTGAVASMYENSTVVLTEAPAKEDSFVEWTGACSGSGTTCTVEMNEAKEVGAVFAGPSKAISPAEELNLSKTGSGYGTVKASGLTCETECTETAVLYQGPVTVPKPKSGKLVVLKQAPAFGSAFGGWSGCDAVNGEGNCEVTMETAKAVTAEYTALPNETLTVNKSAYSGGAGSVTSKPKGINCGKSCTTASAAMPEGSSIVLTEKPASAETTFTGWEGGGCSGTAPTCTVSMTEAQTVTAKFAGPVKAIPGEEQLTLTKAGSGYGTVKASGLTCEVLCASTVSLFAGPPKAAKVTLKAVSAPGSKVVVWSGCESEPSASECVVTMSESKGVTATFDELE
jgi:trimeric autotransporter adhesin